MDAKLTKTQLFSSVNIKVKLSGILYIFFLKIVLFYELLIRQLVASRRKECLTDDRSGWCVCEEEKRFYHSETFWRGI